MKHFPEQKAVKARDITFANEARTLKEVLRPDRETQKLMVTFIEPIEPEFIHICHDSPRRKNRVGTKQAAARIAQIVETLPNRRAVVTFTFLRRIEIRADVLELAQDLGDWFGLTLLKIADREIGAPGASLLTCARDGELRPQSERAGFRP